MTGRFTRSLLFGLGNLAVLLVVLFVVHSWLSGMFAERAARIADDAATLARYRAVIDQSGAVHAATVRAKAEPRPAELMFGSDAGALDADLQANLKRIAERAGARLLAVRSLPGKTIAGSPAVGAHVEIVGSPPVIYATMEAVETQTPYLFVTAAALHPMDAPGGARPAAESLEATLEIYSAWGQATPGD